MQPRGGPPSYTADDIEVLSGLEPVRRRPGMYVGDTRDGTGLHHLVRSAIVHAVEEARTLTHPRVDVRLLADGGVSVADNGRGLPVEPLVDGRPPCEVMLTTLRAGGDPRNGFDDASELPVVNALSARLELTVRRDGAIYRQAYSAGAPLAGLASVAGDGESASGTTIVFWPDPTLFRFGAATGVRAGRVAVELTRVAAMVPGLVCTLTDEHVAPPRRVRFDNRGAVWRSASRPADGLLVRGRALRVDVSVRAAAPDEEGGVDGYTNGVANEGGIHLRAADRALTLAARRSRAVERARLVVAVWHPSPGVDRATRTLRSPEVGPPAAEAAAAALDAWLDGAPVVPPRRADPIAVALEARLVERPDDDEAALVLADHLLASGDPRGELIALERAIARATDEDALAAAVARAAQLVDDERLRVWARPGGFPYRRRWVGRPFATTRAVVARANDAAFRRALVRFLDELTDTRAPASVRADEPTPAVVEALRAVGLTAVDARARRWRAPEAPISVEPLLASLPDGAALNLQFEFLWSAAAIGAGCVGLQADAFGERALVSSLAFDLPSGALTLDAKLPLRRADDLAPVRAWRRAVEERLGRLPDARVDLVLDGKSRRLRL